MDVNINTFRNYNDRYISIFYNEFSEKRTIKEDTKLLETGPI